MKSVRGGAGRNDFVHGDERPDGPTVEDMDRMDRRADHFALKKDALRYRWLREQSGFVLHSNPTICDSEIDAAMKEDK